MKNISHIRLVVKRKEILKKKKTFKYKTPFTIFTDINETDKPFSKYEFIIILYEIL